jgi:hypothetical protein
MLICCRHLVTHVLDYAYRFIKTCRRNRHDTSCYGYRMVRVFSVFIFCVTRANAELLSS